MTKTDKSWIFENNLLSSSKIEVIYLYSIVFWEIVITKDVMKSRSFSDSYFFLFKSVAHKSVYLSQIFVFTKETLDSIQWFVSSVTFYYTFIKVNFPVAVDLNIFITIQHFKRWHRKRPCVSGIQGHLWMMATWAMRKLESRFPHTPLSSCATAFNLPPKIHFMFL